MKPPRGALDADAVREALARAGCTLGQPVSVVAVTGSTNDDAKRAGAAGAPHGALFIAETQTSGRGRGAHAWHSPPAGNVYLSMLLRPALSASNVAPITLAFGVAVASVVEECLRQRAGIKWPNDVEVRGKKIAGVLVEGQLRGASLQSLVVGVGLNVFIDAFPEELAARATSLELEGGRDLDRARIVAHLVLELERALELYARDGLAPFSASLAERDALRGREITVAELRGVAAGIDHEGRLLVQTGNDLRCVSAGEVEL